MNKAGGKLFHVHSQVLLQAAEGTQSGPQQLHGFAIKLRQLIEQQCIHSLVGVGDGLVIIAQTTLLLNPLKVQQLVLPFADQVVWPSHQLTQRGQRLEHQSLQASLLQRTCIQL